MTKGIDVSAYQPNIDWPTLSIDFAILRAGYGKVASQKDKCFEDHYSKAKARNLPVGAYWYSYAMTPAEAEQEAEACLSVLKGKRFEYPIYFDIEEDKQYKLGRAAVSAIIKAFCSKLEAAGYFVGFYTSSSWYNSVITDDVKERFTCWIAHWGVSKPSITGSYGLWQYRVGPIAGIAGDVDLDYGYIDFPALIKQKSLNGYVKQTEEPKHEELFNNNKIKVSIEIAGETYSGELTKK